MTNNRGAGVDMTKFKFNCRGGMCGNAASKRLVQPVYTGTVLVSNHTEINVDGVSI